MKPDVLRDWALKHNVTWPDTAAVEALEKILEHARTEAAAEAYELAAEVARSKVYEALDDDLIGFGNNKAAEDIAADILTLSPDPEYKARIRRDAWEEAAIECEIYALGTGAECAAAIRNLKEKCNG